MSFLLINPIILVNVQHYIEIINVFFIWKVLYLLLKIDKQSVYTYMKIFLHLMVNKHLLLSNWKDCH